MSLNVRRRGRAIAFVLAFALSACSAMRVSYNNADTVLRYMAWEYFDLDGAQYDDVKARLARLHEWHRAKELPLYAELARQARQRAADGVKEEDIAWGIAALRARYRVVAARAAEDAAPLLARLSPEQLAHLERKVARRNEKFAEEYLAEDEKSRIRVQTKKMIERFEDFTGPLSDEQELRIRRFMRNHQRFTRLRFEDRQRWQREALALIRNDHDPGNLGSRLAALFSHPEIYREQEFMRVTARWEADFSGLVVDLSRTLTAEQRARALRRLDIYAQDFLILAGENAFARSP